MVLVSGSDPMLNPNFGKMGCERVLVLVAENDELKPRGVEYCDALKSCGWKGEVELV